MNKFVKSILAAASVVCLAVSCTGCDLALSAYEIAVKNGQFTGTEEQWIASLQGQKGDDGKDLDIYEIYETALEKGALAEGATFADFLKEYFSQSSFTGVEDNDTKTIAKNLTSVVNVVSKFTAGSGAYAKTYFGAGSGVILELDKAAGNATVVTNYHVVYDSDAGNVKTGSIAKEIYLGLYGDLLTFNKQYQMTGEGILAQFVGGSPDHDVAVLKISNSSVLKNSEIVSTATLGNSDDVVVGEKVFAIGNAEGEGISVTSGVISVDSEYITMKSTVNANETTDYRVMRTDAAINHGNSGGGLFNAQGKLIGITNAKSVSEDVDNMGYALPISQVKAVVDNVRANKGTFKSAKLGITVQTIHSSAVWNDAGTALEIVEEIEVVEVGKTMNGLLAVAGKDLKAGDVLVSARLGDGEEIALTRRFRLIDLLLQVRDGDTLYIKVKRANLLGTTTPTIAITFDKDGYFVG
jgi:S1-C subfamily serine protease